ncbi:hypothetical protein GE300_19735 [Rhodobacteraceae bacterium 2CG4]|uniref:7(1) septoil knot domain-containing protein n=1 Tax=Halovulum marinum TaxID=2662447 RepID=A0A6L5Z5H0_9RHOB|nr:DUF6150 family protein [Halovulum marinum]MSU91811.1 hypothetical protein [Halovulum marinum]
MARVLEVVDRHYADLTVEVLSNPALADLAVFRDDAAQAQGWSEQVWAFVPDRHNAHLSVYLKQPDRMGADLRIAFVARRALAGWSRPHRLCGRLCRVRN